MGGWVGANHPTVADQGPGRNVIDIFIRQIGDLHSIIYFSFMSDEKILNCV